MLSLPPQLVLLQKYGKLTIDQLTPEIVAEIAAALGQKVDVSNETFRSLVEMLKQENIDGFADVLQRPDVFPKVMEILIPPVVEPTEILRKCSHCGELNLYSLES